MTSLRIVAAIALISAFVTSFTSAQQCSYKETKPKFSSPRTAPGWEYAVLRDNFRQPRTILFDSEGALLILDAFRAKTGARAFKGWPHHICLLIFERLVILLRCQECQAGSGVREDGGRQLGYRRLFMAIPSHITEKPRYACRFPRERHR
ncbi:hypothetical protein LB505_002536 [Fusarium chuoi]|nr:hypothetical protein LB505_002536 [Fusarium chuoi]